MKTLGLWLGRINASPATLVAAWFWGMSLCEFNRTYRGMVIVKTHSFVDQFFKRFGIGAMTVGDIVFATNSTLARLDLLKVLDHEKVHNTWWHILGVLFLPAYYAPMPVLWAMGKRPYWDNPMERQARRIGGV